MKQPNTAAIAESLERSLRICSLNREIGAEEEEDDDDNKAPNGAVSDTSLEELNRRVSLTKLAEYGGDSSSDGDDSWCESEDDSSSESSPSRDHNDRRGMPEEENDDVLVVAGCKSCYMYYMVPKKAEGCPKCNGHLLRFDGSHGSSPSPP
ncbi:hypothetical protein V6N13_050060 [Hibiscus sabdariffa]|uniref:Uncharacterized protein n=1 Tax=Hibiscus sabdariffa TaxID=183260 RepID=A0ABR2QVC8_9ROSI